MKPKYSRFSVVTKTFLKCAKLSFSGNKSQIPELIYINFRELGGVYIKFLQLLALRSDIFRNVSKYDLYDIYDQVAYENMDAKKIISHAFGSKSNVIELLNDQPFSAGSFGQVYKARYKNRDIILKILRPSVVKYLDFDLKILSIFSFCIDIVMPSSAIASRKIYKQFARATKSETNYILEADYATSLRQSYAENSHIVIPETYREISNKYIISQDFVGGILVSDILRLKKQGVNIEDYIRNSLNSDLKTQLINLGSEMLIKIFTSGITYGDPHPGNIKLLPNNKIGLIDYGLQATAPKNKAGFYELVKVYSKIYNGNHDVKGFINAVMDMYGGEVIRAVHSLEKNHYVDGMTNGLANVAYDIFKENESEAMRNLSSRGYMYIFNSIVNRNNQFCLKYDLDGPEIMRAGLMFIELTGDLGLKLQVVGPMYNRVIQVVNQYGFESNQSPDVHPDAAIETLAAWVDRISIQNPALHRKIVNLQRFGAI